MAFGVVLCIVLQIVVGFLVIIFIVSRLKPKLFVKGSCLGFTSNILYLRVLLAVIRVEVEYLLREIVLLHRFRQRVITRRYLLYLPQELLVMHLSFCWCTP
jgi:hypothetical protein